MARGAKSAKTTGGNWLPVARGAEQALGRMRALYATVLRMREVSFLLLDKGQAVTPMPSEWDCLLDEIQGAAEDLRRGLKGRK